MGLRWDVDGGKKSVTKFRVCPQENVHNRKKSVAKKGSCPQVVHSRKKSVAKFSAALSDRDAAVSATADCRQGGALAGGMGRSGKKSVTKFSPWGGRFPVRGVFFRARGAALDFLRK